MGVQAWELVRKKAIGELVCFCCGGWITCEKRERQRPVEKVTEGREGVAWGVQLKAE